MLLQDTLQLIILFVPIVINVSVAVQIALTLFFKDLTFIMNPVGEWV